MKAEFNIVAIGAGSAGLITAYIAAAVKAKVALIEKHKMGGDCLNYGCVPSKAIIRTTHFLNDMKRCQELGVKKVDYEFDFADVMNRVHQIIGKIEPHDSIERYTGLGVDCFQGNASIIDPNTVQVGDRKLTTKNIVLAMGAEPFVPPIEGLDKVEYLTSENLWSLKELPKRLIVLGGGPIGSEMAQAFARLGSKVTQVERNNRILGREDEDVSELISEAFRNDGVDLKTDATATRVTTDNGNNTLIVKDGAGKESSIPFDKILVAVGRKARTEGWDWDKFGISLNPNGTIKVDEYLRANGSNIYACGDIAGPFQFTHTAAHQAWYCAVNALFSPLKKFKADYSCVPWVTFTDPEVAQVGHNETSAKAAGIPYEVTTYPMNDLDRAIAESEDHGFVKVLTPPGGKDTILGVTIVGRHAGENLAEFTSVKRLGGGLNKILGTIHPYPTYSEANKGAAGAWKKANKPEGLLKIVEAYHRFRRR